MMKIEITKDSVVRTLVVAARDIEDVDDLGKEAAREAAESHLQNLGELGGWGGDWYFDGAERSNYDEFRVTFVQ
jgi:hypothetical protein